MENPKDALKHITNTGRMTGDVVVDDTQASCGGGRSKCALIIIDMQNDFCLPGSSLYLKGALEIVPVINRLKAGFDTVFLSRCCHPANHISFYTQHQNARPFTSLLVNISKYAEEHNIPVTTHSQHSAATQSHTYNDSAHTSCSTSATTPQELLIDLWPVHCIEGTKGYQLVHTLQISDSDILIDKGQNPLDEGYSAFGSLSYPTSLAKTLQMLGVEILYVCGLALDYCVAATAKDAVEQGKLQTTIVTDGVVATTTDQNQFEAKAFIESLHASHGITADTSTNILQSLKIHHTS